MCRNRAVPLIAVALVVVGAGAGPRAPAARVLEVKGKVSIVESEDFGRPAVVYGTVYADDRLVVAKDAKVTLVFRGDGHIERVVVPGTFRVTQNGCRPRTGVQQTPMSEQNRAIVGRISKGSRGIVQGGVVVARAAATDDDQLAIVGPGDIRPIDGSTVLAAKPTFAWPATPEAKEYTLSLFFMGNRVWSAVTKTPQVEYSGADALKPGAMYTWEATATVDGKPVTVFEGAFHTATEGQRGEAADLEQLLAKPEPAYLALAAMWYKQNGFISEAIAANEQLAKLTPEAAVYWELVELYFEAGHHEMAGQAEAKAMELEEKAEAEGSLP